ncbi:MAG: hypothetical protein E7384_04925 [Ruminococcaceae bacterium]|nr:hypothetical protein [Oscillospiraceae bacterium]
MNKNIKLWSFAGFTLTVAGGTLLHFLYDITNQNILVASFSAVNESTWEHMKLMFFPQFFFALFQCKYFKDYKNFWCVKLTGILTGLLMIPVLFYTYNGAVGKSPDWLNITFFLMSAAVAFIAETYLLRNDILKCKRLWIAYLVIILLGILFVAFTFAPPELPIFRDAITGTYGI